MKKINKKIVIIIISILLAVVAVLTATYSFLSSEITAEEETSYTTGYLSVKATSSTEPLNLTNSLPMSDREGEESIPYTFTVTNTGNVDSIFNIRLLATNANSFSSEYIKVKVDDDAVLTLSDCPNSIIKKEVPLAVGESIDITIRLWLSLDTPNTELGKTFNSQIVVDSETPVIPIKLNEAITSLYMEAPKITVTNKNVRYNYAQIYDNDFDSTTSGGLMNDRLGGTTTDYNGGNIRYYGANPSNYIYFNCSDYTNQSDDTCEKWRIIGIFGDLVKIARNDLLTDANDDIAEMAWDYQKNIDSNSTSYSNNWATSSLREFLNNAYYYGVSYVGPQSITSYEYYSYEQGWNNLITRTLDLSTIGLKNKETRNKIAETTWYLGGYTSSSIYSHQIYEYERGDNKCSTCTYDTTWTGNIALMYPSDYGYATDFTKCSENLYNYNSNACRSNDYLFEKRMYQWFLTPYSSAKTYAWSTSLDGEVFSGKEYNGNSYLINYASDSLNTRPVLYLTSDQEIIGGDGTSDNPYKLKA